MDLGSVQTLRLDASFSVLGVPATVTRPAPDDTPIATTGIWQSPLEEDAPFGTDLNRREPRRVLALRRDSVPTLPRGTRVLAPEKPGGANKAWSVDGLEQRVDPHCWYAILVVTSS